MQNLQDVVYLKNGGVIRGLIIEQVPNQSIKIQTADRNVFVFKMDEILKITKEEDLTKKIQTAQNSKKSEYRNPGIAFLWSFLWPGGGQFYNRQTTKGIIMAGAYAGFAAAFLFSGYDYESWYNGNSYYYTNYWSTGMTIGLVGMSAVWLWSAIDAPVTAGKINLSKNLGLNFKINDNLNLALQPDLRLSRQVGERHVQTFGAKLSLAFN